MQSIEQHQTTMMQKKNFKKLENLLKQEIFGAQKVSEQIKFQAR